MTIQFRCDHCHASLRARPEKSGRRAKCKKCGQVVRIPTVTQAATRVSPETSATAPVPLSTAPQRNSPNDTDPVSTVPGGENGPADDPFANMPEFQTLEAPVERQFSADEEFQRMMMGDDRSPLFNAATPSTNQPPPPPESLPTASAAPLQQHGDLAGILNQFEGDIHSAVEKQKVVNERAVRAKFTVEQIRAAFQRPLGDVERLPGLRSKQFRSAVAVALVPVGFIAMVVFGSFAVFIALAASFFGESGQMLHPFIGLPLIVLGIVLLFAWIPALGLVFAGLSLLFARKSDDPAATQLTRENQPVMYEFVDQICEKLGSPKPCRIDLDCEFNASAHLRRGWFSSGRKDLVLTIGIPLIASQNTEQLASVIAHEFGHFRQGSAMKTSFVIQRLTQWFMVSALNGLGYFYYFGYLTHWLSGSLSREMEWDADRHAVQLAGTKAFVESSALLERYGVAYAVTIENLIAMFHGGALVDNVPRLMMHIGRTMPAAVIRRIAESTEKRKQDRFDSHPPTRDRVNAARELNQPGIISLQRPATDLVDHWVPLCKKITMDFYTEQLQLERGAIQDCHMTPLEDLLRDEHKLLMDLAEDAEKAR